MDICQAIRRQGDDEHLLPVVMVTEQEDQESDAAAAGITDWLIKPFTSAYARTKIRAWVLRTACQRSRRGVFADEARRAGSPRAMRILDTGPAHRFDRMTDLRPMPQKGTERRRSSERVTSSDKAALLWIYGREIAPFETPAFSSKVGEIIARATSPPRNRAAGQRTMRPRDSNYPGQSGRRPPRRRSRTRTRTRRQLNEQKRIGVRRDDEAQLRLSATQNKVARLGVHFR
jgi:hypothetical protein